MKRALGARAWHRDAGYRPFLPREGEGLDLAEDLDPVTVESAGYDLDGYPMVYAGRVALDDIQEAQLRKASWRMRRVPSTPA